MPTLRDLGLRDLESLQVALQQGKHGIRPFECGINERRKAGGPFPLCISHIHDQHLGCTPRPRITPAALWGLGASCGCAKPPPAALAAAHHAPPCHAVLPGGVGALRPPPGPGRRGVRPGPPWLRSEDTAPLDQPIVRLGQGAYQRGSNPKVDYAIAMIDEVRAFLTQGIYDPAPFEETRRRLLELMSR